MEGVDGISITGNTATDAKIIAASTGLLNVFLSQFNKGMISCKGTIYQLKNPKYTGAIIFERLVYFFGC